METLTAADLECTSNADLLCISAGDTTPAALREELNKTNATIASWVGQVHLSDVVDALRERVQILNDLLGS